MRTISILGCGWLGLPLALRLKENDFLVRGSTTTHKKLSLLKCHALDAHVIDLSLPYSVTSGFFDSEILVISIPPKLKANGGDQYISSIRLLQEKLKATLIEKVILISTTAVYPDVGSIVREDDALSDHPIVKAEKLLLEDDRLKSTVIRLGGLIGPGRHPSNFFKGKEISSPAAFVNMITRNDCIKVVISIIQSDAWGQIFNACADQHPTKEEFYTFATRLSKMDPPRFLANGDPGKIVSCEKIKAHLGIEFENLNDSLREMTDN